MHPMFMAALFTVAKTWKQPTCPSTGEWIKMWYIYAYICSVYMYIHIYVYIHTMEY